MNESHIYNENIEVNNGNKTISEYKKISNNTGNKLENLSKEEDEKDLKILLALLNENELPENINLKEQLASNSMREKYFSHHRETNTPHNHTQYTPLKETKAPNLHETHAPKFKNKDNNIKNLYEDFNNKYNI